MKNDYILTLILFFIFAFLYSGCREKEPVIGVIIGSSSEPDSISRLQVIEKGNISSYEGKMRSYMGQTEQFLPYALIMANKYKYMEAYLHVYKCLSSIYYFTTEEWLISLDFLENNTQNMALYYLKKGAEFGDQNALRPLGDYYIYGKYVEQDSILGQNMKNKADSIAFKNRKDIKNTIPILPWSNTSK